MTMKYHKSLIICFSLSILISLSACKQMPRMDNSSPGAATVPVNNTPESSEITNSSKLAASRRLAASQARPATSIGRVEGNETRIIAQISEHAKNWQNARALESVNQFFAKINSMSNEQ